MKRLFLSLTLLWSMAAFAQTDNFVVHVYDPPISGPNEPSKRIDFDVDEDGVNDYFLEAYREKYNFVIRFKGYYWNTTDTNLVYPFDLSVLGKLNTEDIHIEGWGTNYSLLGHYGTTPGTYVCVLKKVRGNDWYYGWAVIAVNTHREENPYHASYEVYATAMCTIPNQHITLGQYSMSTPLAIDQSQGEDADLLVLDQGGRINICAVGDSQLDKVMVADCMGRVVFTRQGINRNMLDIEKGALGAGIFIVRYSLQNGKVGIKKIYIGNR